MSLQLRRKLEEQKANVEKLTKVTIAISNEMTALERRNATTSLLKHYHHSPLPKANSPLTYFTVK